MLHGGALLGGPLRTRPLTARSAPSPSSTVHCPRYLRRDCVRRSFGLKEGTPEEHQRAKSARSSPKQAQPKTKQQAPPQHAPSDELVELNVGGRLMLTARSTLLQVEGSLLHSMFGKPAGHALPRGGKGEFFLDFEPELFGLVLRYLRELKMSGVADATLSNFREEDRPHLLVMLRHLRLLPPAAADTTPKQQQQQQQQQGGKSKGNAAAAAPSQQVPPEAASDSAVAKGHRQQHQQHQAQQQQQQQQQQPQMAQQQPKQRDYWELPTSFAARAAASSGYGGGLPSSYPTSASNRPVLPESSSSGSSSSGMVRGLPRASSSSGGSLQSLGNPQKPVKLVAPPVPRPVSSSQLYYVQAGYEEKRGTKISVFTESDLRTLATNEPFDIFCDVTHSEGYLSFTFVCRQDFDNMFVGVTSRCHTDRKGSQVPCFGWKSRGAIYSGASSDVRHEWCPLPGSASPLTKAAGTGASSGSSSSVAAGAGASSGRAPSAPLWSKGDSVELIVTLGDALNQPHMVIKVNGREIDHIAYLPPLHNWSWYLALTMGADMSCAAFMSDSYAVYWGDYQVKRFLTSA